MNLLNLPDYTVTGVEETSSEYRVTVRVARSHAACPTCQTGEIVVDRWSRSTQTYRDLPMHGRQVTILVERQRYRCRSCGRTWMEALPGMAPGHRMTARLRDAILTRVRSERRSNARIAREVGVSEGAIRALVRACGAAADAAPS